MYLGKFEYISNVDSATYVVWGETFCTPGWSIGSVNKRGAGYLRQKLFGGKYFVLQVGTFPKEGRGPKKIFYEIL